MAEVSDITIKRTQDSLGKLIKKPALTDKLLRKPPFKFLHDIIAAVRISQNNHSSYHFHVENCFAGDE